MSPHGVDEALHAMLPAEKCWFGVDFFPLCTNQIVFILGWLGYLLSKGSIKVLVQTLL